MTKGFLLAIGLCAFVEAQSEMNIDADRTECMESILFEPIGDVVENTVETAKYICILTFNTPWVIYVYLALLFVILLSITLALLYAIYRLFSWACHYALILITSIISVVFGVYKFFKLGIIIASVYQVLTKKKNQ